MLGPQSSSNDVKVTPIKIGDLQLTLNDKKVPLDHVTHLHYMEGSLKILREMILKDKANTAAIMEHVGYLIKVASMGQVFTWKSVLNFDQQYRKSQASSSFPWGADSPFLMQLLLKPKQQFSSENVKSEHGKGFSGNRFNNQRNPQNVTDPASGKIVCGRYNGRNGCYMNNCRYIHVCAICFSNSHGRPNHKGGDSYPSSGTTQVTKNY